MPDRDRLNEGTRIAFEFRSILIGSEGVGEAVTQLVGYVWRRMRVVDNESVKYRTLLA